MRSSLLVFLVTFMLEGVCPQIATGQNASRVQSVRAEAAVDSSAPAITLDWQASALATNWIVFRKKPAEDQWTQALDTLSGSTTSYTDAKVSTGEPYEYRVAKVQQDSIIGEGYLASGIQLPPRHFRGRLALVMDQRLQDPLNNALTQFKQDLTGAGWAVEPIFVDSGTVDTAVKDTLQQLKTQYPDSLEAVLLLGQVPVPYSGGFLTQNIPVVPDGHQDHGGAWPADVYYATEGGAWTDVQISNSTSKFTRNHNEPRDGKFDQSALQQVRAEAELMVGRIDLSDLPAFDTSELALLERYIRKNHQYRHGEVSVQQRGIVDNNFSRPEGFGQNGFRNFSPLVGKDRVDTANYQNALTDSTALWSYGAGGGKMNQANGIAATSDFVKDTFQGVFTMIFGSYFGDFDGENNLMRAALASRGSLLSVSWAGRPHWHYHSLGMGAPLGQAVKQTQNNAPITPRQSGVYQQGAFAGGVHVALLGDPTLTLYPFQGPEQLDHNSLITLGGESNTQYYPVALDWEASPAADGYYVYRYEADQKRFTLLNEDPVSDTRYVDTSPAKDTHRYMVRATRLKTSPSGSYHQLSQGIFDTVDNKIVQGLADQAKAIPLEAYPNPVQDQVRVAIPKAVRRGSLQLLTIRGKVIAEKPISSNTETLEMQVGSRASGTYMLRIRGSNKPVAPKRIVVK